MNNPNDAFAQQMSRLIIKPDFDRYWNKRDPNAHEHVKSASAFQEELINEFDETRPETGDSLPWIKADNLLRFRGGELTIWSGINGHGKSNVLGQCCLKFTKSGSVCVASLEMKPVTTLARMCRQSLGSNNPTPKFIGEFIDDMADQLWLYDQQGTVSSDRIVQVGYYVAEELRVKHFVVDSLMKCGINDDDYNGQKKFIDALCALAKDTNCHVHLVTHSRKGNDEFEVPGKMSVKGSGSITDQAFNVLTVWRNKKKEAKIANGKATHEDETAPDCLLICDKQRNGTGWEGRIGLWFDPSSMRYTDRSKF